MRIYVGNMPFSMNDDQVRELFEAHGRVESVDIITDRQTGRPRGFAFVDMPDESEGRKAIEALHEFQAEGRNLNVNEARPREDRGGGGGRRGGFGGGGRNRW
ncbi:MAG: RNA-binding protein [Myxococcota bacterium]|nr:RNA-binding protein [Myxococcota bacterium]